MIKHMRGWAALPSRRCSCWRPAGTVTPSRASPPPRSGRSCAPSWPPPLPRHSPEGASPPAEAERIARGVVASIPPRSAPADYTAFVVDAAIAHYRTQGRDATLAHYSRKESIDGQWYVFIIGEDARVVAHPDPNAWGWT